MISPIIFFVQGIPKAQPRPRAFARMVNGKPMVRAYNKGTAEEWKSLVAQAAKPHLPNEPLRGALRCDLNFYMPRPKSHFRSGKFSKELRADAPKYHSGKHDKDNMEKAVTDALTNCGMWRDDSQIADGRTTKKYEDFLPGCEVRITELD